MNKIIPFLLLILVSPNIFAHKSNTIFWGADTSVDFGRFQDRFEITPMLGFRILPKAYLGIGATLSFYSSESYVYEERNQVNIRTAIKDKIWYTGGELFLRYIPFEQKQIFISNIYIQASYEALWGNGNYYSPTKYGYKTVNYTPFIGIGYKQPLSERFSLGMMLSFKLNKEADSPYRNPIIGISFEF